jgi:hypothetical protein
MAAPMPKACGEKRRLLLAFTDAVSDYHRMQSAQLEALVRGDGFDFEIEIARAAQRRERAKYAVIAHQQEHGCFL